MRVVMNTTIIKDKQSVRIKSHCLPKKKGSAIK